MCLMVETRVEETLLILLHENIMGKQEQQLKAETQKCQFEMLMECPSHWDFGVIWKAWCSKNWVFGRTWILVLIFWSVGILQLCYVCLKHDASVPKMVDCEILGQRISRLLMGRTKSGLMGIIRVHIPRRVYHEGSTEMDAEVIWDAEILYYTTMCLPKLGRRRLMRCLFWPTTMNLLDDRPAAKEIILIKKQTELCQVEGVGPPWWLWGCYLPLLPRVGGVLVIWGDSRVRREENKKAHERERKTEGQSTNNSKENTRHWSTARYRTSTRAIKIVLDTIKRIIIFCCTGNLLVVWNHLLESSVRIRSMAGANVVVGGAEMVANGTLRPSVRLNANGACSTPW